MVDNTGYSKNRISYKQELLEALYPLKHFKQIDHVLPYLEKYPTTNYNLANIFIYAIGIISKVPKIMQDEQSEALRNLLVRYSENIVVEDEYVHKPAKR